MAEARLDGHAHAHRYRMAVARPAIRATRFADCADNEPTFAASFRSISLHSVAADATEKRRQESCHA